MGVSVLTGLLDEKIIRVISLFMKYPNKKLYLSEIARLSNVNTATTFRILNKLIKEKLVYATVIGKVRIYQLSRGERVDSLMNLLKKDKPGALKAFCDKIKLIGRIETVLLNSKTENEAKLIIVGDCLSKNRINNICTEIYNERKFKISFVELSFQQYSDLEKFGAVSSNKEILFKRH